MEVYKMRFRQGARIGFTKFLPDAEPEKYQFPLMRGDIGTVLGHFEECPRLIRVQFDRFPSLVHTIVDELEVETVRGGHA